VAGGRRRRGAGGLKGKWLLVLTNTTTQAFFSLNWPRPGHWRERVVITPSWTAASRPGANDTTRRLRNCDAWRSRAARRILGFPNHARPP